MSIFPLQTENREMVSPPERGVGERTSVNYKVRRLRPLVLLVEVVWKWKFKNYDYDNL